jgi:hypothetical protein
VTALYDRPPLSRIIILAVMGAAMLPLAVGLSAVYDLVAAAAGVTGIAFLVYALLMSAWYISAVVIDLQERRAEILAITPRRRELEAIRQLTPEQLALVPRMDHAAKFLRHSTRTPAGEWITSVWFSTAGGDIPVEFCQEFLSTGGVLMLRPINSYSEGTLNYNYARWFTEWLRLQALAVGGEGSQAGKAAQWVSDASRLEAFNLFDVSMELDAD